MEGRLAENVGSEIGGTDVLTYKDSRDQGNWGRCGLHLTHICQRDCRSALHESGDWIPHRVLFDREKVLTESTADPAARARYIAEMQKTLADPKIRTENPLEVMNILNLLSTLSAKEAVSTFVDYLFYDWKTGADYRIKAGDSFSMGTFARVPGCTVGLAHIGESATPLILARIAQSTREERSMDVGGGGAPVFVNCYFYCQGKTQTQAIESIESFKRGNPNLTKEQTEALDSISVVIGTKRYRPYFFKGEWAAPPVTNAVPIKRP